VAASVLSVSCSRDTPAVPDPTTPAPPNRFSAEVTGIVRGQVPPGSRVSPGHTPLAEAEVSVVDGPGQRLSTRTDAQGAYVLRIPQGSFRLRWSASGYKSAESAERTLAAGERITMPDIVLSTAPWAIAGRIIDSRGNPVSGAVVTFSLGGAFLFQSSVTSDGVGRYRFESESPHGSLVTFHVSGHGIEPLSFQQVACCNPQGDTINDIRVVRVLSVTQTGPSTLRVGESVELPAATVVFDDGTQRGIYILPASSDPAVVAIDRGQRGFVIRGVQPGIATITFDHRGIIATLRVRVLAT
jgi:hypothetical protein